VHTVAIVNIGVLFVAAERSSQLRVRLYTCTLLSLCHGSSRQLHCLVRRAFR